MNFTHDLLLLGSQNAKAEDQELSRNQIHPEQWISKSGSVKPIYFFDSWGKVGVSSMAWHPAFPDELFVSINTEIRRLDTRTRSYERLAIEQLADIHDIHFIKNTLWISNTEFDEAIGYNPFTRAVESRHSLSSYRRSESELEEDAKDLKDQFHCNQVFEDFDGNLCVLIHNISGWQYYRKVLEMLVRRQGDGGIINLSNQKVHQLKLQSPHTVRLINGDYWVQDSSDQSIKIFDTHWELLHNIPIGGFGRGMDFTEQDQLGYVGISATRKRYLRVIPSGEKHKNRVLQMDLTSKKILQTIDLSNIEQVDNVYLLEGNLKKCIERLS